MGEINLIKEIDLNVTNRCNANCLFCSYKAGKGYDNELTKKEIFQIIDQAKSLGVEDLHLTGGEPTLRDDLVEIVQYASSTSNCHLRLISNGFKLDREYLKRLYNAGLRDLMLSLDGKKETYEYLRGLKGGYEKIFLIVKEALALNFSVRLNLVANKKNLKEVQDLIIEAIKTKVHIFSIFMLSPIGRGNQVNDLVLSAGEWISFTTQLKEWVRENKISEKIQLIVEKGFGERGKDYKLDKLTGRGVGCRKIGQSRDYLIICANGDIYPCVFFVNTPYSLGNIRTDRLEQIVLESERWDFYQQIEGNKLGACVTCPDYSLCAGGCRGYSGAINGDYTEKDPRCTKDYYPLCPILKENFNTEKIGGSTEEALGNDG